MMDWILIILIICFFSGDFLLKAIAVICTYKLAKEELKVKKGEEING